MSHYISELLGEAFEALVPDRRALIVAAFVQGGVLFLAAYGALHLAGFVR